ncbi:MAG: 23S rRNA (guanosine(2251)-2'-O)-methyltransferase RlmB [Candidatus Geothermincolia bacterium]
MAAEKSVKGVLYGVHPVEEALRSGSRSVGVLYLAEGARGGRLREIEQLARTRGLKIRRVDVRTLDRLVGGAVHQGVVVEAEARPALDLDEVLAELAGQDEALLVVLDGVQDPHNLGAVVRNAALTGAAAVLIPKDRSAGVTPVVEKVAAGGLEHVKVVRAGNIAQALRRLKEEGFWIYGAAGEAGAEDLYRLEFAGRAALVLGEEHEGLRRLTRELCDRFVRIPSTGAIDSFNLGTASGIILARIFAARMTTAAGVPK